MSWNSWIRSTLLKSPSGRKLPVPAWLPHPRAAGFKQLELSQPAGQCRDWAIGLTDGSRVHVHEMPDGRLLAHRDQWDPARGGSFTIKHLVFETALVPIVLGLVIIGGVLFGTSRS